MNIEDLKFTKEELKELQTNNNISTQHEVQNFAIYAINELRVIQRDCINYSEQQSVLMKKKLEKLLADIVSIRKTFD